MRACRANVFKCVQKLHDVTVALLTVVVLKQMQDEHLIFSMPPMASASSQNFDGNKAALSKIAAAQNSATGTIAEHPLHYVAAGTAQRHPNRPFKLWKSSVLLSTAPK